MCSDELVNANLKKEWLDAIKPYVIAQGFQDAEFGFEYVQIGRLPGQTISINGRVMQKPGKEIKIKYIIEFVGDGWVANVDETNKEEFTQVKFESYQDNELISEYEEAFFWHNPNYFIESFNRIFR